MSWIKDPWGTFEYSEVCKKFNFNASPSVSRTWPGNRVFSAFVCFLVYFRWITIPKYLNLKAILSTFLWFEVKDTSVLRSCSEVSNCKIPNRCWQSQAINFFFLFPNKNDEIFAWGCKILGYLIIPDLAWCSDISDGRGSLIMDLIELLNLNILNDYSCIRITVLLL